LVQRRVELRVVVGFFVFEAGVVVGVVVGIELGRWWVKLRLVVGVIGIVQLRQVGFVIQLLDIKLGQQLDIVVEFRIDLGVDQFSRRIYHHIEETHMTRRQRGDDGVAIVEAAIIMPLLMLVLFGFMEYSNLFKDKMSVGNAAHDAAREASQSANFYDADFSVLVIAAQSLRSLSADVTKVIIFKASSTSDAVPPACLAIVPVAGQPNGVVGICNVYLGSYLTGLGSSERPNFGFVSPSPDKYDKMYPALTRSASRTVTEYVGVYIEAHYEHITGAVPTPSTIKATAVTPIEARTA
jgi:TadE-like protein